MFNPYKNYTLSILYISQRSQRKNQFIKDNWNTYYGFYPSILYTSQRSQRKNQFIKDNWNI